MRGISSRLMPVLRSLIDTRQFLASTLVGTIGVFVPLSDAHAETTPPSPAGAQTLSAAPRAASNASAAGTSVISAAAMAQASEDSSIRPFKFHASDEALADLRRRIAATKWPSQELVTDASQGVQLATMRELARYWQTDYDWRKFEARLNALPQFMTTIDGVDIHFIHVRSKHDECVAGHRHARVARLDHRAVEDHRSADQPDGAWRERIGRFRRRDSVIAGPWVFREAHHARLGSRSHRTRLDRADETPRLHAICGARRRLGQCRHGADGPAAASGTDRHSHQHARHGPRRHRQGAPVRRPAAVRPLGRREICVRSARLFLQARPGLRPGDGQPSPDAVRRSRIRRSASPPGCSTTTRAVTRSSHASLPVSPRALRETTSSTTSRSTG